MTEAEKLQTIADKTAKYYKIDFYNLTVEAIAPGLPLDIKKELNEKQRERLTA